MPSLESTGAARTVDPADALRELCDRLDAMPDAMCAAFTARMHELQRVTVHAAPLPRDTAWWREWYDHLVVLLRVEASDPQGVALAAETVRWGRAAGLDELTHRLGFEALAWACRDAMPGSVSPVVLASFDVHGAMLARVSARLRAAAG